MSDYITALRDHEGSAATKVHTPKPDGGWATEGYGSGWQFQHRRREVSGIEDLYAALAGLERHREWYVIRGDVREDAPPVIRRIYRPRPDVPVPHIVDADRQWLCVDIDGAPADERCHVTQALELLPPWLREATCVWQFSASHGVKPADQIRLHLWFWLARPVGNNSLRAWAKRLKSSMPYIDPALYNPCQPHYVARPVFQGADDPVSERLGLRRGKVDEAVPPMPELLPGAAQRELDARRFADRQREATARRATMSARQTALASSRYAKWVREDIEALAGTNEGGRHDACYYYARRIASLAHVSEEARHARAELEAVAVALLPDDRQDEAIRRIDEGWDAGLSCPRDQ